MDEVVSRLKKNWGGSFNASTAYSEAWIFAQCTQKCVSVVGVFRLGRFAH